ncbi:DENN domain-containing protein 4B [Eumeta japonica]|uniref:DENN domain-containing protein 4B n=1 Tax=Eumeta variegata TaxID=151549 RepID=A0A4C1V7X1_EUMVA|nr:DENN domain-containing protein 4B [Eumeta japonica]
MDDVLDQIYFLGLTTLNPSLEFQMDIDKMYIHIKFEFGDTNDNASSSVRVLISSCSQCHQCLALLYDEDIMAGWAGDDSNLNTRCTACGRHTVPMLSVQITRSGLTSPETVMVPYLNPLVLRKEFESILSREGDSCLADPSFVESHPIIYWNLVWFLERANINSHLPELLHPDFHAKYQSMENVSEADHPVNTSVCVVCAWEWRRAAGAAGDGGDVGAPLHRLWRDRRRGHAHSRTLRALLLTDDAANGGHSDMENAIKSRKARESLDDERWIRVKYMVVFPTPSHLHVLLVHSVVLAVLDGLRSNDLTDALRKLAAWRENTNITKRYHSYYRDILFLALTALGENNIDLTALQREYTRAYEHFGGTVRPQDSPPSAAAVCCRHYFKRLRLRIDQKFTDE